MAAHSDEFYELVRRVRLLSPVDRLALISRVAVGIQQDHFPPSAEEVAADAKAADEWAAHYNATRGWEAPYPLTDEELALIPNPEVCSQDAPCDAAKSIT